MQKFGPRIYNLFPRLLGPVSKWYKHVERIKKMNFDWIYLNPVTYSGFSGSLYAIKNHFKFNPIFAEEDASDPYSWDTFKEFIEFLHKNDIQIMYDLVINHTATDADLVHEHPEWYLYKYAIIQKSTGYACKYFSLDEEVSIDKYEFPPDEFEIEKRIASPYAIDPSDANKITIWGDLAELDYTENAKYRDDLIEYFINVMDFYLDLGIDGFRCDAAYKIPPDVWNILINHAKSRNINYLFMAETLGCTLPELKRTMQANFDYINNSSKWWDFTADWCVKQYNEFRKYAPSIGFPESHDTERLAKETGGRIDVQIFRYLFAAFFSAGVLMPIGYEFGFEKRINVVEMIPEDYEEPHFDITNDIRKINLFKKSIECLNEDGEIVNFPYPDMNILVIRKTSLDEKQHLLLIYNKNWNNEFYVYLEDLSKYLPLNKPIYQINIEKNATIYKENKFEKKLKPNEFVFFLQE